ncbi:PGN_0703 family putative restriction endonuclease [Methylobacterium mesophilicum]|uniref:PGN_0703 family putative restriction endonuclease n=1 Tax=Methylobacterium mesophilicum TaxID=39956 RepID=UPI002F3294E7
MDITAPPPPATADDPSSRAATARAVLDPSGLGSIDRVPLIPEAARRQHRVFVPADHRFKAAARFIQALWREDRGLAIGTHVDRRRPHRPRRLGSRLSTAAGALGANFIHPDIVPVVARALAYREPGAAYDVDRLRTNLLSSQPLAFNLFGLLARDPQLATRFVAELFPGTLTTVTDILFEHSPGRGDPHFTADRTAYDVVMRGRDATGARALLCIEMKYSEAGHEPAPPPHPRHAQIARTAPGLFVDPDDPTLTGPACQQLYRQHCLASAMLKTGLAETAMLAFIAPTHNQLARTAAATYTRQLADPQAGPIPFMPTTLEHAFAALATVGLPDHARALHRRYTDFWLVDGELDLATTPALTPTPVPAATLTEPTAADAPPVPERPVRRGRPHATRPFVERVVCAA